MKQHDSLTLGIDIGSTTAKVVLVEDGQILYEKYQRHFSQVRQKILELLAEAAPIAGGRPLTAAISGSAGLGLAEGAGVPFVQEVFATSEVVRTLEPDASAVVELGGEDAKIIFFDGGIDERMNGSCAGGTGAFIDQMATLLNVTADELDALSLESTRLYPIASRCGVFAKTDIQPLLNQGAKHADVAASIYQAVVNQEGPLPGRAPLLLQGPAPPVPGDAEAHRRPGGVPGLRPVCRGHGRGPLRPKRRRSLHHGPAAAKDCGQLPPAGHGQPPAAPVLLPGGL